MTLLKLYDRILHEIFFSSAVRKKNSLLMHLRMYFSISSLSRFFFISIDRKQTLGENRDTQQMILDFFSLSLSRAVVHDSQILFIFSRVFVLPFFSPVSLDRNHYFSWISRIY